jgi:hypothetical protein
MLHSVRHFNDIDSIFRHLTELSGFCRKVAKVKNCQNIRCCCLPFSMIEGSGVT